MNNKQKGIVTVGIFLFLFSGGWYANEWNKRMIHEKGMNQSDLYEIQSLEDRNLRHTEPFQPREYIRISDRFSHFSE
ncbi:hypothetical protein [Halalkalibacter nanhaiisediminis]|uniref:Uncharacterized protein n=1 Tax=Halalkalibacter nanhaiisediminis TaxID=688079 RepID=A0A562QI23_9BACI|nr:hypothetical protein [Halalkalibacter nanhaiisediminis]TWI56365.1 hypothetical protein IQ10_02260 [Halalkalibacter nanhaiisediminis]